MRLLNTEKLCRTAAAAVVLAALPCSALAQDAKNSINIAVAAAPSIGSLKNASMVMLEYERLVTSKLSVFGRGSSLKYKWDDDTYVEDGKGTGLGVGVRFFPTGGLKGFYVGGAVSALSSKWDWIDDKGKSFETRGKGDSSSVLWGVELGYRINLGGGNIALTPALNVGSWLGGDNTCTYTAPASQAGQSCSKDSQIGVYAVASVALNIGF